MHPYAASAATPVVKVQINDSLLSLTGKGAFIDSKGFTQVPVRAITEKLGASVHFEKSGSVVKVTISKGATKAVLHAGSSYAEVGSERVKMDTVARVVDGQAYVPVRFISETFGYSLKWDAKNRLAMISTDGQSHKAAWTAPVQKLKLTNHSEVTSIAQNYLGTRYVWGGSTPSGFDCSGYIKYVYAKVGVSLPHSSISMHNNHGTPVAKSNLQEGDLVFFITNKVSTSHVGIYLGNNKFISATSSGIKVDSLNSSYWGPKYNGANRVL
ncbi:cell wall lytic activity [Paenibacillus lemnae]|uniref:Cell wall lytic activity n=1 Tax=Paenibacillus lemnae TaxID=1330551 RepID=A0A848M9Y5_PAELE|nr:cell wall lytic activity [Paenibacillus lemnae]